MSGPDTHMFNCFQLKQVGKLLTIQNLWILHSVPRNRNIQDSRGVKTWKISLLIQDWTVGFAESFTEIWEDLKASNNPHLSSDTQGVAVSLNDLYGLSIGIGEKYDLLEYD